MMRVCTEANRCTLVTSVQLEELGLGSSTLKIPDAAVSEEVV